MLFRSRIDIVVVYKIDRLTRSLPDFAKLVDVFDRNGVSFVSVTQQFNTTTSMGRLTLNILLSFAQFEREVTGERIRDKIAASKAKGMWMGGPLPLGYDVRDRLLIVNDTEAKLVRRIFDDFVTLRSATLMAKAYGAEGAVTKSGKPFTKQTLYKMLHNRMYLGEIVHKGKSFPGKHQAIVTQAQWDAVHALIATDGIERRRDTKDRQRDPVLLRGLLFTPDGERLVPSYTVKKAKTYRYYSPVKHRRLGGSRLELLVDDHADGARVRAMQRKREIHRQVEIPTVVQGNGQIALVHTAAFPFDSKHTPEGRARSH